MQSTPSLPSVPGPFCSGVIETERVLFNGQIELKGVVMLNLIV